MLRDDTGLKVRETHWIAIRTLLDCKWTATPDLFTYLGG